MSDGRSKSTQEEDLERRLSEGEVSPKPQTVQPVTTSPVSPFATDEMDLSGYVGVSQEYQNYANDTEKPLAAPEDSVDGRLEQRLKDAVATSQPSGQVEEAIDASNETEVEEGMETPSSNLGDAGSQGGEVIDNPDNSHQGSDSDFPKPPSL